VVSYLQEQVRSSRRQVRDAVGDNKVHWFVDVIRQGESSDLRALLEVEPLPSLDPPVPPPTLQRWLDPEEWTQPKRARPRIKARAGWRSPDTPVPEEVLRTYDVWVEGWQQWADQERELVAHRTWYAQLEFLERETLQRIDTHELVVGVGLLSAYAEERWSVRRHLLTWSVSIDRDEQSDVLRLMLPVDVQARVEDRGFLNAGDGFNLRRGRSPWHEEEISGLHPFSSDASAGLRIGRSVAGMDPSVSTLGAGRRRRLAMMRSPSSPWHPRYFYASATVVDLRATTTLSLRASISRRLEPRSGWPSSSPTSTQNSGSAGCGSRLLMREQSSAPTRCCH
jgi:hypothetical protein